jgi:hypothetical protein
LFSCGHRDRIANSRQYFSKLAAADRVVESIGSDFQDFGVRAFVLAHAPRTLPKHGNALAIREHNGFHFQKRSTLSTQVQFRMESMRLVDAAAFGATDNLWRTKCVQFKFRELADR